VGGRVALTNLAAVLDAIVDGEIGKRERQVYYADPANLKAMAKDLLDIDLFQNQMEWHDISLQHDQVLLEAAVGHGKSTWLHPEMVQMMLRAKITGKGQAWERVLFITGNERLARDYTARVKASLRSKEVVQLYGEFYDPNELWSSLEFRIRGMPAKIKEPSWRAAGVNSGIEGTRATMGILDDPIDLENALSPADRVNTWWWFTSTFLNRLDEGAKIICIGSSWHPEDLYSRIRDGGEFATYKYPCYGDYKWGRLLCPWLMSENTLEQRRNTIGGTMFDLRLMMNHKAMVGGVFDEDWILYLDEPPKGMPEYGGWDFATTSKEMADKKKTDPDYTAGISMGFHPKDGRLVITDIVYERIERGHEDHIKRQHDRRAWVQAVVEINAFQKLIKFRLHETYPKLPVTGVAHYSMDKAQRILNLQVFFERGFYLCKTIPKDKRAAFINEYLLFPHGEHDDALDAAEIALALLKRNITVSAPPDVMGWL